MHKYSWVKRGGEQNELKENYSTYDWCSYGSIYGSSGDGWTVVWKWLYPVESA